MFFLGLYLLRVDSILIPIIFCLIATNVYGLQQERDYVLWILEKHLGYLSPDGELQAQNETRFLQKEWESISNT